VYEVLSTSNSKSKDDERKRRVSRIQKLMNAKEGDVVRVIEDEARAASLNSFLINGRGGWSSEMKSCLGMLATVIEVVQFESKRLLKLKFKNDKEFDFNSKSVSLVTENEEEEEEFVIDGVKSKQQDEEDKEDLIVGAEDFFPIFLASLVYSDVESVWKLMRFAELFCVDRDASKDAAQVEYYLTSFEAAVHWILQKSRRDDDEDDEEEEEEEDEKGGVVIKPSHCRTAPYRDGTRKLIEGHMGLIEKEYCGELLMV